MNDRQEREIRAAPSSCRRVLERAYSGKSRTAAVKAMCLRCVGYVRQDVTDCTARACPLWPYRPFQQGDEAEDAGENGDSEAATPTAAAPEPRI